MPSIAEYFTDFLNHAKHAFFTGLLPVLTIAALIYVAFRFANSRHHVAATAFLFALVGSLVGLLLGSSRDPAVQAIVPALVTLLTGYLGWTLRKEAHADQGALSGMFSAAKEGQARGETPIEFVTVLVFAAITGLMTATAAGTMWGASLRLSAQDDERRYEEWRLGYEKMELPIQVELLRRQAGLTPAAKPDAPAEAPKE